MSDVRKKLEDLLITVADTLAEQVKASDCPASTLAVAVKLLKDNGIEARVGKSSPLGNLADSLPKFDDGTADDELPTSH